jgi:hypothetical protein
VRVVRGIFVIFAVLLVVVVSACRVVRVVGGVFVIFAVLVVVVFASTCRGGVFVIFTLLIVIVVVGLWRGSRSRRLRRGARRAKCPFHVN